MCRLEFVGFELLPVLPVDHPTTTRLNMLARRDGGCGADYGDKIITSFDLHPKNRKTVLWVVIGDSFNESVQDFGHEAATSFDFS